MQFNDKETIWVEKYRPQFIEDVILSSEELDKFKQWKEQGQIPNIGIFSNTPGTGKTSISKAIINSLDADSIFINASKDNGIDMVRSRISSFVSSISFTGSPKIVILDECDGTTAEFQKAFRGFIEEYSQNARFILTGNYKNKIIEPLLNRLITFDFDQIFHKNSKEIGNLIKNRLEFILDNENINYTPDDLKPLIKNYYPSVREMIMTLQGSVIKNDLKLDNAHTETNRIYIDLINSIKSKDFIKCRVIVRDINNPQAFYNFIYKNMTNLFLEESLPRVVILTHDFLTDNLNYRDPEISLAAYCATILRTDEIKFK